MKESAEEGAERSAAPRGALAALRHRNFRVFYAGQILSLCGTWMQSTAQGWLVLELTNSALLLGVVTAAGSLPSLVLTLWAGVVADRGDKRRIILLADIVMGVQSLALAVLTHVGLITYPVLLLLVLVLGTASAFEVPTRQSFFAELVGKEDLPNAIALNSAAFNGTRIVGPALAGWLIAVAGTTAACFYANAVSFLFVVTGLMMMRLPPFRPPERTTSGLEDLREGIDFIRGDRLARTLVGLIAAMSITAFPYTMLLPVFARDVLHVGATGLGWLLAATGMGALMGGVALAAGGARVPRGPLMVGSVLAFCVSLIAFTFVRSLVPALVLLGLAGFTMILNNATLNALLQSLVPDRLRGRVMSVYVFMFMGMIPIGALQAGALSRAVGAPYAVAIGAAVLFAIAATVSVRVPELRRVR
ncbi:MAG TPA: MFS transporter [Longimicrobium sp.]